MKIEAAVLNEMEADYEIQEVNLSDEIKDNEVLVKIVASGLCKSDLTMKNTEGIGFPNVLGHEGAGIVQEIGKNVKEVEPGDHVILSYTYCGECESCQTGHPSACTYWNDYNKHPEGKTINREKKMEDEAGNTLRTYFNQSSFATYSLTDESNMIKIDKDLDLRLMGPLACGFTTGSGTVFSSLDAKPGESIAVFGTGAVGFSAIMAAKISGCYPIVAIDINEERLETAKEMGATHTFNNSEEDPEAFLEELTAGEGLNHTIDTTGVPEVLKAAIHSLKTNGSFVPLAVGGEIEIDTYNEFTNGNKKLIGSLMGDVVPKFNVQNLIQFYRNGDFPFDQLIEFFDFEEINEAEAASTSGNVVKPVVIMDKEYQPEN
jgi:aryl-alcohol dehydrogenase